MGSFVIHKQQEISNNNHFAIFSKKNSVPICDRNYIFMSLLILEVIKKIGHYILHELYLPSLSNIFLIIISEPSAYLQFPGKWPPNSYLLSFYKDSAGMLCIKSFLTEWRIHFLYL